MPPAETYGQWLHLPEAVLFLSSASGDMRLYPFLIQPGRLIRPVGGSRSPDPYWRQLEAVASNATLVLLRTEHVRRVGPSCWMSGSLQVPQIGKAPLAGHAVQRRFTHVWKKEGGDWRLIARHANNVLPSR